MYRLSGTGLGVHHDDLLTVSPDRDEFVAERLESRLMDLFYVSVLGELLAEEPKEGEV